MPNLPDDWEKIGRHLNPDEIQGLRVSFNCGEKARSAARRLKCSTRIVQKYYAQFGGKPNQPARKQEYVVYERPKIPFDPVKHRETRFYRGNFEL